MPEFTLLHTVRHKLMRRGLIYVNIITLAAVFFILTLHYVAFPHLYKITSLSVQGQLSDGKF